MERSKLLPKRKFKPNSPRPSDEFEFARRKAKNPKKSA
jgi:hypothetical protein